MPTVNPRVTVMLSPEDYAVLASLSELQGVSKSSLIADVWSMACPVMSRVVKLLLEAKNAQESVKVGIREASEEAIKQIEPVAAQAMLNWDLFEEAIRESILDARSAGASELGTIGASQADAAGRGENPPSSNTGVRFQKTRPTSSNRGGKKS
jgi:hypothetical protein